MNGMDLYAWMRREMPYLTDRVIFITGDSVSRATHRFLDETGAPYLCKPFGPSDLTEKIRATFNDKN